MSYLWEKFSEMPRWAKRLTIIGIVVMAGSLLYVSNTLLNEGIDNWMDAGGDLKIYSDGASKLRNGEDIFYLIDNDDWDTSAPNYYHPIFYAFIQPISLLFEAEPVLAVLVWWAFLLATYIYSIPMWLRIAEQLGIVNLLTFITAYIIMTIWNYDMAANLAYGNIVVAFPLVIALIVLGVMDRNAWKIGVGCAILLVTKPMWLTVVSFVLLFALRKMLLVIAKSIAICLVILMAGLAVTVLVSGSVDYTIDQVKDQATFLKQVEGNYPFVTDGKGTTNSSWKQSLLQYDLPDISSQIRIASFALFGLFTLWVFIKQPRWFMEDLKLQLLMGGIFYFVLYQSVAVWMDTMHAPVLFALLWSYDYKFTQQWYFLLPAFVLQGWILIYKLVFIIPHKLILAHIFYVLTVYVIVRELKARKVSEESIAAENLPVTG